MQVLPRSLVALLAILPFADHGSLAAGPSTGKTEVETRKPCDLDGSGRCDLRDRYLFQLAREACQGDRTSLLAGGEEL